MVCRNTAPENMAIRMMELSWIWCLNLTLIFDKPLIRNLAD